MAERTLTGAGAVVRALEAVGVEVAFGLPGVHNLALWRALGDSPIRLVGVRHEQAAAYAADGYASASGRLGVAIVTTGPGAANTLAAVGEAWASRSPLLVIATDVPSSVRRAGVWRGSLHEASDQAAMFAPVVKEVVRAGSADRLGAATAAASHSALTAPRRPAYLEIPTDLLAAEIEGLGVDDRLQGAPEPDHEQLARAAGLLEGARRPLIWAGGGALQAGAGEAVAALAERLVAPVLLTYSARGLLPPGHPCLVEAPPHVPEVGALWDEADCVLAVGSDLDAMMTQGWRMARPPHLIAVNLDPGDAAKNYLPDLLVEADARAAVTGLVARIEPRTGLEAIGRRLGTLNGEVRRLGLLPALGHHAVEVAADRDHEVGLVPQGADLLDMRRQPDV